MVETVDWTVETLEYALDLERRGLLDRDCRSCQAYLIPEIKKGKKITDIFAPMHKAMDRCRSGKYPHCTCDTCF
jgi:hypothetical protein